jgi:ribonuclease III
MLETRGEEDLLNFSARLGFRPNNFSLFFRALTHRSYFNEHPEVIEDNERLEFLGDAVLDFIVASWLYHHFPEMAEGDLTRIRAALVGNNQLAEFSRAIGLHEVILLGKGEQEGGGRLRNALLGSAFEAIVGALYLDQGIPAVQKFMNPLLEKTTLDILEERKDLDPKSQLQEWTQSQGYGAPVYTIVEEIGPDHAKVFIMEVSIKGKVYARGRGHSKQIAAKEAARQTIDILGL